MDDINALTSDQFELLSAYVDGEVSPTDRKQVEEWLESDPELQKLYQRLLTLQHKFRTLPSPPNSVPVEQTVMQVMNRIDRRPRLILWGGIGAAAAVIGTLTGVFSGGGLIPQTAQNPGDDTNQPIAVIESSPYDSSEPSELMIALDRPPVEVPAESLREQP